ncbi:flagellar hook-associated protein FlgL [Dongshaea marina]|uniref:flagellar hook-associated protein FlgL n=1 Tax=Dongshaea marina TaxID=2047966 RepID=UPI000D3EC237|nr:flagellar hook-associated protein FlgL [Dongshaea marina]
MRITNYQMDQQMLLNMQRNWSDLNQVNMQLSANRRVLNPSDDPVASIQSMKLDQQLQQLSVYQQNSKRLGGALQTEDGILKSTDSLIQSIHENLVQLGDGALSPDDKKALGQSLQQKVDQLVSLMNSKDSSGSYIFAGSQVNTAPVVHNADGSFSFQGDGQKRQVTIGGGMTLDANDTLAELMGSPDGLNAIATLANDAAAGKSLSQQEMDEAGKACSDTLQSVDLVRNKIGGRLRAIESVGKANDAAKVSQTQLKEQLVGLDYADAVVRLNTYQITLQASEQVFTKLNQLSLFNYMGH